MLDIGMRVVLANNGEDYLEVQREQLLHGQKKDGGLIGTYQSLGYMRMKQGMGLLKYSSGAVDLFLTGKYQGGLTIVKKNKTEANVFSRDGDASEKLKRYGGEDEILGLNHTYLQKEREYFMPRFRMECAKVVFNGQ
jgi:hypothetical protein